MAHTYPKTVAAATAETKSKLALAEALAMEIPPRTAGRRAAADDEVRISALIAEARTAIIEAGGEPRDVLTLKDYRKTAVWVAKNGSGATLIFRWVPGFSYTAHNEARARGLTYDQFAADPMDSRKIRSLYGKAKHEGPPEPKDWDGDDLKKVAEELTTEQAKALVEEVLDRDEVRRDRGVRATLADAQIKTRKEEEERVEKIVAGDSTSRKFESAEAHDDLKKAMERFVRDSKAALARITDKPISFGIEDYFLPALRQEFNEAVSSVNFYFDHGKTDVDAFMASLSKE